MTQRVIDNYRDKDGLPVSQTFAAYMIETQKAQYLEVDHIAYADWLSDRRIEFAAKTGTEIAASIGARRAQFIDWLNDRAADQVARHAVEAAA